MSDLKKLQTKLTKAKTVLIMLPLNAGKDIVASGLSLYLSLSKAGKQTSIVSGSQPVVRDSHLVGLDKIATSVGGNNLVITVNLPENAVDKVTSNVEGGHLNLVLAPQTGSPAITKNDIIFGTSGASADLIIVVGTDNLAKLGTIADKENELFSVKDKLVNLSNLTGTFGAINLTDTGSSNSELVTAVIQELKLPLDKDIASNLMQGIEEATGGLSSPKMTADTFEALAVLYRTGARRSAPTPVTPVAKVIDNTPIVEPIPSLTPSPVGARPSRPSTTKATASPDWLKPKIYKGSTPTGK